MSQVVFVPGAWCGGWSWVPTARRVATSGHDVVTPTLPGLTLGDRVAGLSLADAVDAIVDLLDRRDLRDVVLVCHSWGGYPASAAAHRASERVRKVVYYNAVVPAAGSSMADENEMYGAMIREAVATAPDGAVPIDLDAVQYGFMPGDSAEAQRLVHELLLPQPGRYMTDPSTAAPVTSAGMEAEYLLGVDDRALARPGEEFAARLGVAPVFVPGTHLAMFTRPDEIAPAIITACG